MNNSEMVKLAALVAQHGPALIEGECRISTAGLEQYWVVSKCRFDAWGRALKKCSAASSPARTRGAVTLSAVAAEILTGEVLTRVWTAVLCAYERRRGDGNAQPIAESVFRGHLEARNRVLSLLVHAPGVQVKDAVDVNRLRGKAERWVDLLIGALAEGHDVSRFAADPKRARQFADDLRDERGTQGRRHIWPLTVSSLAASFPGTAAAHPELNGKVASSILACFPAGEFDSVGMFQSLWTMRLWHAATDAEGMVNTLCALDRPGIRLNARPRSYPR